VSASRQRALFPGNFPTSLTLGAEPFLRSSQLRSHSKNNPRKVHYRVHKSPPQVPILPSFPKSPNLSCLTQRHNNFYCFGLARHESMTLTGFHLPSFTVLFFHLRGLSVTQVHVLVLSPQGPKRRDPSLVPSSPLPKITSS
jgi:hypothetical protein